MVEEAKIPVIETKRTSQLCRGNRSVPAITTGVLGNSVKPLSIENAV